jgi:hypothetical protein
VPSNFLFTIYDLLVYSYLAFLMLVYAFITKLELLTLTFFRKIFNFGNVLNIEENENDMVHNVEENKSPSAIVLSTSTPTLSTE